MTIFRRSTCSFMYACGAGAGLMSSARPDRVHPVSLWECLSPSWLGNGAGRRRLSRTHDQLFDCRCPLCFVTLSPSSIGANYGANLALFPSITKDYYGLKNFGVNYGLVFRLGCRRLHARSSRRKGLRSERLVQLRLLLLGGAATHRCRGDTGVPCLRFTDRRLRPRTGGPVPSGPPRERYGELSRLERRARNRARGRSRFCRCGQPCARTALDSKPCPRTKSFFRQSRGSTLQSGSTRALVVAEGLHPSANADVQRLLDALEQELGGSPGNGAILTAESPRLDF